MYGNHSTISNALEELRKGFVSGIPARLEKIDHTIEHVLKSDSVSDIEGNIQTLGIAFHSLAGTASTYGYYDISRHAKAAERHLNKLVPKPGAMQQAMEKLSAYIQAIQIDLEDLDSGHLPEQKLKQLTTYLEMSPRTENLLIYLADEDNSYIEELHTLLISSGYQVEHFATLYELEERIRYQRPDILILNCGFSGNKFAGLDFISGLQESMEDHIPMIFISEHNDIEQKYRATAQMGCFFLDKPIAVTGLLYTIELVINRHFGERYRVMLVDSDVAHSAHVSDLLQQSGMQTQVVNDAKQVLTAIDEYHPEVILLDIHMPEYNGIELASMIRLDPAQQFTSIVFISSEHDPNQQLQAIDLGGTDFLIKPIDPKTLIHTVDSRAERTRTHNRSYSKLRHTVHVLEQFKVALDQHAIVSAADRNGKIIYANPRFCEISGYQPNELIGRNHNILNSGFHDRHFFSDMWQTITAGKTWKGEVKNRTKTGGEYWVESTITPLLDEEGKPYQYISIRTDITRQKLAAEKLAASEERLRRSQIYANIGTWDWDIKTGELHWSEQIAPLFGYNGVVDTTYDNFIKAVHPDDRQFVMGAVTNCVENGASYDIEHRIVQEDGEIRWLSEKGDVVRDESGQALHMLGVVQDITLRKAAEEALQASQTKLKGMFDLSPLGIALTDMDGNFVEFNKAFIDICGYSEEELLQLDYWTLTPRVYEEQEAEQIHLLETTGRYGPYEKEYRQKNGNLVPIRLNGMLVHDPSGEIYIWSIVENITDSKLAEQDLIAAKEEAESANRAKSEFLSRMSHELRTPLNAILGFAQLMESDPIEPLSENHKSSNEQILKAGWHLLELINEVLDLSKIESGMLDFSMESVDAVEVIQECLGLVKSQTEQYKVNIVNNISGILYVQADRTRFKQVFLNLLTNAIKYNRRNGTVTLNVEKDPTGTQLKFIVQDTGSGFSSDQMEHLFEPFNRLGAEDSAIEGTGIGLVITRKLVEIMGGEIGVDSTPDVGSKFYFTMKCADPMNPIPNYLTITESDEQMSDTKADAFTILYVEDNPANLKLVAQILTRISDVHLHSESTGINGLNAAKRIDPDLLLLDINLPDMTGIELANEIRSNRKIRHVPMIAISANAMPKDIDMAFNNGFDDYLTKPIDVTRFITLVNKFKAKRNQDK